MKKRYDARVKTIQLESGSFAFYYCPRRRIGRYQKWTRLCQVCRIVQRFNDVTYSIQLTPRSKPFIAHIDRLRPFEGELPAIWRTEVEHTRRNTSIGSEDVCSGNDNRCRKNVPSADSSSTLQGYVNESHASLPSTAINESHAGASAAPDIPANKNHASVPAADDNGSHANTSQAEAGDMLIAGNSKHKHAYDLRPAAVRSRPHRIRHLVCNCERSKSKVLIDMMRHKIRTQEQKIRRRQREQRPRVCPFCSHVPFTSASGFRDHVILVHQRHCSWSGIVRPFTNAEEERLTVNGVLHNSGRRSRVVVPVGPPETRATATAATASSELPEAGRIFRLRSEPLEVGASNPGVTTSCEMLAEPFYDALAMSTHRQPSTATCLGVFRLAPLLRWTTGSGHPSSRQRSIQQVPPMLCHFRRTTTHLRRSLTLY